MKYIVYYECLHCLSAFSPVRTFCDLDEAIECADVSIAFRRSVQFGRTSGINALMERIAQVSIAFRRSVQFGLVERLKMKWIKRQSPLPFGVQSSSDKTYK